MEVCRVGMRGRSSSCDDIYIFFINHGGSGWFAVRIISRNGDILARVSIFETLSDIIVVN